MKTKHAVKKTHKKVVALRKRGSFFFWVQVQKFDEVMAHEGTVQHSQKREYLIGYLNDFVNCSYVEEILKIEPMSIVKF